MIIYQSISLICTIFAPYYTSPSTLPHGQLFLYTGAVQQASTRTVINSPRLINSALSSIESFLQKAYNTTIKVKATLQLNKQQIALRKAAGLKGIQLIFFKPSKPITQTEFVNQRDGGSRVYVNADSNVDALEVGREVRGAAAAGAVQAGDGARQTEGGAEDGIVNSGKEGYNKNYDEVSKIFNLNKFTEYLKDIEVQTGRKMPLKQIIELKKAIKNNKFKRLDDNEKAQHREAFNNIKDDLIGLWESNTDQVWPKHGSLVKGKSGKILRNPNSPYDAHEIIPNMYGGPLKWWNIHPARWPNEHQGGIHRSDGVWNELFK